MPSPPFDIHIELDGWVLYWAQLELRAREDERLDELRRQVSGWARERWDPKNLSDDPTVKALRRLFRATGCDPTRYRPSSEALLRRLLKGDDLPAIGPIVDISNALSAELAVPVCVMSNGTFEPPLLYRAGRAGETYVSLRGPFKLEGKPLLCDAHGPLDCPITGNEKVKVTSETHSAWLVAYMPSETMRPAAAHETLERLVRTAPVVRILQTADS